MEISDVEVAPRTLAESRLAATVTFHQRGFTGRKSMLRIRDGGKTVGAQEITFGPEGEMQGETLLFNVGSAGEKTFQFSIDALPDEENTSNNSVTAARER